MDDAVVEPFLTSRAGGSGGLNPASSIMGWPEASHLVPLSLSSFVCHMGIGLTRVLQRNRTNRIRSLSLYISVYLSICVSLYRSLEKDCEGLAYVIMELGKPQDLAVYKVKAQESCW